MARHFIQHFKKVCPRASSYTFYDETSTFSCAGADNLITFCPSTVKSLFGSIELAGKPLFYKLQIIDECRFLFHKTV
ncbi:hypothetical protein LguiA_017312 [Lonicera macranthoides]